VIDFQKEADLDAIIFLIHLLFAWHCSASFV